MGFLGILNLVLMAAAAVDCLRRREQLLWIVFIVIFQFFGALLYFAYTYNLLGRLGAVGAGVRREPRRAARVWDVPAGDGTPAQLQVQGARLVSRGQHKEAIAVFEQLLDREGPHVPLDARYNLALAYKAVGRWRDARDQLSLVVGEDPRFRAGQAFLELADCHYQMDDNMQARNLFEQLLRIIRFPEARYKYGILLDHMGNQRAAAEQMRLLLGELDAAPEFHRRNNRRYAKLAKRYLHNHG